MRVQFFNGAPVRDLRFFRYLLPAVRLSELLSLPPAVRALVVSATHASFLSVRLERSQIARFAILNSAVRAVGVWIPRDLRKYDTRERNRRVDFGFWIYFSGIGHSTTPFSSPARKAPTRTYSPGAQLLKATQMAIFSPSPS
jgi:hypothetical protein